MAIYVTGDVHADPRPRFERRNDMTADDIIIICGDFGLPWWSPNIGKSWRDKKRLDWLAKQPYTTVYVDGNHENFDLLYQFPVKEWNGGLVHQIRPNVLHLMRGEIFNINGFAFFAFGGARSTDQAYRVEKISWWKQEIYSPMEWMNAKQNLQSVNYSVDIVLTHTAPKCFIKERMGDEDSGIFEMTYHWPERINEDPVSKMLSKLEKKIKYKMWYYGHFHDDWVGRTQKCRAIYTAIDRID